MPDDTNTSMEEKNIPPLDPEPTPKPQPGRKAPRLDMIVVEENVPPVEPHIFVNIDDPEIMGMDPNIVIRDLALVKRGIAEFNRQCLTLGRRKNDIEKKLKDLATRSSILNRYELQLEKTQGVGPSQAIKDFQARTKEAIAKRRENALRFIHAGTTPKEVIKTLQVDSPIDAALKQRKPLPGQGRPGQRPLQRLT